MNGVPVIGRQQYHLTVWLAAACLLGAMLSASATNTFQTAGDWHNAGNWNPGPVPVDGEDVRINANVTLTNTTAVLSNYVLSAGIIHTFGGTNTALIASNVTVLGSMTHSTNTATTTNAFGQWVPDNRIYVLCTNLTVAAGGVIHADGRGYKAEKGPGAGVIRTGGGFGGGGGYGGDGGFGSASIDTGGVAYGSATLPFDPGSGGGRPVAGAGGGAIWIEAANHVLVNGTIRATGGNGDGGGGAASGSGGGIYIRCLTIAGTNGTISANAGANSLYGCSGGGRVAVQYDTTAQGVLNATAKPVITFAANAGAVAATYSHPGRPGTLWFPDTGFFPSTNLQGGVIMIPGFSSWIATNVTISQGVAVFTNGVQVTVTNLTVAAGNDSGIEITNATLTVLSNLTFSGGNGLINGGLTIGNSNLTVQGVLRLFLTNSTFALPGDLNISGTIAGVRIGNAMPLSIGGSLNVNGGSNTIANAHVSGNLAVNATVVNVTSLSTSGVSVEVVGNVAVTNAGKLYVFAGVTNASTPYGAEVSVTGNVTVTSNSWIYPVSHNTNGGSPIFRMQNLTILHGTNAGFNASSLGFGGKPTSGNTTNYGPGGGTINGGGWAGGGGHGGKGANGSTGIGGPTYGSATNPINPGSAGGRVNDWGGGMIRIVARGTATLSGALLADGAAWPPADGGGGGGGSGGAIFITCKGLAGSNAKLSAKGGDARTSSNGGGGGGGRIAIWRVPVLETADTNSWTLNVNGGTAFSNGSPGSVYWGIVEMVVPPAITNGLVSAVTSNSANLNGYLTSTGTAATTVSVCWGTVDGGTNGGIGWQNTNAFSGTQSEGALSTNITTLLPNTVYYYRYLGANAGGDTWADPPIIFSTGDTTIQGTDTNAAETGFDPAVFTILRPTWATNGPMTVWYAVGGSASNGVDYELLSGEVFLAPGVSNATVTVTPVADAFSSEGSETVILTLVSNAYVIGSMNVATAWIADAPVAATNVWSGSGNWTNVARWSAGHKPVDGQYVIVTGSVTLAEATANMGTFVISNSTFTFTNWSAKLSATDIRVGTNVTLTLPNATLWGSSSNRVWIACSNLFLHPSSQIDVTQKGYQHDSGPGTGIIEGGSWGGGGYGGSGGGSVVAGLTYGNATNPVEPGSGGGGSSSTAGGGAVRIEASGHVVVNGKILANSGPQGGGWACGSGGSIYLACRTVAGTNGTIAANGGDSSASGGSGGGGRVAVLYDTVAQAGLPQAVTGMIISAGQGYGVNAGQPGTIYLPDTNFFPTASMQGGSLIIPGFTSWTIDSLSVTNGRLGFPSGFQLSVTNNLLIAGNGSLYLTNSVAAIANLVLSNAVYNTAPSYVYGGTGGAFNVTGNLTLNQSTLNLISSDSNAMRTTVGGNLLLTNSARLYVYGVATNGGSSSGAFVRVNGSLVVGGSSWIIPVSQGVNGGSPMFSVRSLTILGTNSGFDANSRGFSSAEGPGRGQTPGGGWYGGGGYGGRGASTILYPQESGGITYGSSNAPVDAGSGGGRADAGAGGGSIRILADASATINGSLLANGGIGSGNAGGGGGSGGGIYLYCRSLYGTGGVLTARGGAAQTSEGPGGGGRIAIWRVNDYSVQGGWTVSAAGGIGPSTNGFPGTIVWGSLRPSGTLFVVH